jgi:hypothetical protein
MINSLFHISHSNTLKIIDFAYFCFMMKCGVIIFGGKLPNRKRYLLKANVAIVVGAECRCSRRSRKRLYISSLARECTFV